MYGTIAQFTAKPGSESGLQELMGTETPPDGAVFLAVYKLDSGNNEYMMCVGFTDKQSYVSNAEAPETNDFYQKFRALLTADPVWHDGEIIESMFA